MRHAPRLDRTADVSEPPVAAGEGESLNTRVYRVVKQMILVGRAMPAVQLVRRWPDSRVYVPMCAAALRAERNRDIVRRYTDGESFDTIRRRYKITRVHLYRLLKKPV